MTSQNHTIAVVDPSLDGETTLEYAKQTVDQGGRASVIVLLGRETVDGIVAFSKAEELAVPDGREIFIDQLARRYSELLDGKEQVTIIADRPDTSRFVFDKAHTDGATSVVVPQRLVNRRKWKTSVARSQVPVVVTPPKAA